MPRLLAVLLAAAALLAPAPVAAAGAAEEAGQTSLSVDDVTISPETGASQTIHIAGNLSAPITVKYSPLSLPWPDYVVARGGNMSCQRTAQGFTCEGTGDLTIRYPIIYFPPESLHDSRYTVTATTPDGGYDTGSLRVRFRSDFSVWAHNTGYVGPNSGASTTLFNATVQTLGPDPALKPTLRVTGLDISLGAPAGCTVVGGGVTCALEADLVTVTFTVAVCTSRRPVQVSVSTTSDDPNPGNDTYTAPGLDPIIRLPQCPGDSGGSAGGGSGGGGSGSGGGGAPAATPSGSVTPSPLSSSPQPAAGPTNRTRTTSPAAAAPAAGDSPVWGALAAGMGVGSGIVLAVLVSLLGVHQWRRRKAATDANGET